MKKLFTMFLALMVITAGTALAQEKQPVKDKKKTTVKDENAVKTDQPGQVKPGKAPVKPNIPLNQVIIPENNLNTPKPGSGKGDIEALISESKPIIETKPNGQINWTEQYIEAKGRSVIDNERFKIPAQAKLMAQRGAVVDAQRNLLEIINGVNVTSETKVQDMITTSDYIYTRLDGVIKGAKQVGEPIEKDGMIEITMRVPIYSQDGLAPAIYDAIPQTSKYKKYTPEAGNAEAAATSKDAPEAIAFNLNGKKYDPSMFPIVVDDKGNLLLDYSKIYDTKTGNFPKILETSKELLSTVGATKGVELIDVIQSEPGKLVIDSKHSGKFWSKFGNTAAKIGKFLLMLL